MVGVLGLARAGRDDRAVAVARGPGATASSVSERVPTWFSLDQDGVGRALLDALARPVRPGWRSRSSPIELDRRAEPGRQAGPARPVVLGQAVLDRDDREPLRPPGDRVHHLARRQGPAPEQVGPVGPEEPAGGQVEGDGHVGAGLPAGALDRLGDQGDGLLGRGRGGAEAALVPHERGRAPLGQQGGGGVVDAVHPLDRRLEIGRAQRHGQHVLDVHPATGVEAPADDVHHGERQGRPPITGEVPPQRHAPRHRAGPRAGGGDGDGGVGPEPRPVPGPVEVDHGPVEGALVRDVHAGQPLADRPPHRLQRTLHALAAEAADVAVAALDRLVPASGRARGGLGEGGAPAGQDHGGLHRGGGPGVQHPGRLDALDRGRAHRPAARSTARARSPTSPSPPRSACSPTERARSRSSWLAR